MRVALTRVAAVAPRLGPLSPLSPLSPPMADLADLSRREPHPPTRLHRHRTSGAVLAVMRVVAPRATTVPSPLPGQWLSPPRPSPLSPLGPLAMDASRPLSPRPCNAAAPKGPAFRFFNYYLQARARESNKHCDREIETPESTRLERRRERMRQRRSTVFRGEALVMRNGQRPAR